MHPVLCEIGPLPPWAAVGLVVAFAAFGLLVEWRERRAANEPLQFGRAAAIVLTAGAMALLAWWVLDRWGPAKVRSWGTMLMLGFLAGMLWAIRDARHDPLITTDLIIDMTLVILIGAVIGARAVFVALKWQAFRADLLSVLQVWAGGMSFHGGLLGGTLAASILAWRRRLSVPRMADLFAPSIALGYAITRIGCFLNGCCHGIPTDLPWGVTFPEAAAVAPPNIALHPTQLYASAASLIIFGILLAIRSHLRRSGHLFLSYLVLYSIARFGVEHFRRGASATVFEPLAPLTIGQVASIAIAAVACAWMLVDRWRARRTGAGTAPPSPQ